MTSITASEKIVWVGWELGLEHSACSNQECLGLVNQRVNFLFDTALKCGSLFDTRQKFIPYLTSSSNLFPYLTLMLVQSHSHVQIYFGGPKYPLQVDTQQTKVQSRPNHSSCRSRQRWWGGLGLRRSRRSSNQPPCRKLDGSVGKQGSCGRPRRHAEGDVEATLWSQTARRVLGRWRNLARRAACATPATHSGHHATVPLDFCWPD
jgi:hypothetical protein